MSGNLILVVDDDPNDLQIIASAFAAIERPLTLVTAESVDEAARQLQDLQGVARPDLVVTDMKMPRRDGTDLIKQLRADYETPPVIIALSTTSRQRDIDDAYRAGANAFHTKPMSYVETIALCAALLDYWVDQASLPESNMAATETVQESTTSTVRSAPLGAAPLR